MTQGAQDAEDSAQLAADAPQGVCEVLDPVGLGELERWVQVTYQQREVEMTGRLGRDGDTELYPRPTLLSNLPATATRSPLRSALR